MTSRTFARTLLLAGLMTAMVLSGCSKSNNLLLGRVETTLGAHTVIVTDCYRTNVPPAQILTNADSTRPLYRFAPCVDADVIIDGDQLIVNGVHYGTIQAADSVIVDHEKVFVNSHPAEPLPSSH